MSARTSPPDCRPRSRRRRRSSPSCSICGPTLPPTPFSTFGSGPEGLSWAAADVFAKPPSGPRSSSRAARWPASPNSSPRAPPMAPCGAQLSSSAMPPGRRPRRTSWLPPTSSASCHHHSDAPRSSAGGKRPRTAWCSSSSGTPWRATPHSFRLAPRYSAMGSSSPRALPARARRPARPRATGAISPPAAARSPLHRLVKQAARGFEDEKYAYLVVARSPVERDGEGAPSPRRATRLRATSALPAGRQHD